MADRPACAEHHGRGAVDWGALAPHSMPAHEPLVDRTHACRPLCACCSMFESPLALQPASPRPPPLATPFVPSNPRILLLLLPLSPQPPPTPSPNPCSPHPNRSGLSSSWSTRALNPKAPPVLDRPPPYPPPSRTQPPLLLPTYEPAPPSPPPDRRPPLPAPPGPQRPSPALPDTPPTQPPKTTPPPFPSWPRTWHPSFTRDPLGGGPSQRPESGASSRS